MAVARGGPLIVGGARTIGYRGTRRKALRGGSAGVAGSVRGVHARAAVVAVPPNAGAVRIEPAACIVDAGGERADGARERVRAARLPARIGVPDLRSLRVVY